MIHLGLRPHEKAGVIQQYVERHDIRRVVILGPEQFAFPHALANAESIDYPDIYTYVVFHRLMQEIDSSTLLVINECLRTRNRHDLTYNVIRQYLNLTPHQLIFQVLPIIASREDFMVLFDWDTRSRWKSVGFDAAPLGEAQVQARPVDVRFDVRVVEAPAKLHDTYARKREALFGGIGAGDPDKIPRQLYQVGAKARLAALRLGTTYLSTRTVGSVVVPYEAAPAEDCGIFELPFRFAEFRDHLARHPQRAFDVVASDLKADAWFVQRYRDWVREVQDVFALVG